MAVILDFENWLSQYDYNEADYEDIYCLYKSVEESCEFGAFKTSPAKGLNKWIVSCLASGDQLLIASDDARKTFLKLLTRKCCGDLEMEGWHCMKRGMAKAD